MEKKSFIIITINIIWCIGKSIVVSVTSMAWHTVAVAFCINCICLPTYFVAFRSVLLFSPPENISFHYSQRFFNNKKKKKTTVILWWLYIIITLDYFSLSVCLSISLTDRLTDCPQLYSFFLFFLNFFLWRFS